MYKYTKNNLNYNLFRIKTFKIIIFNEKVTYVTEIRCEYVYNKSC